MPIHMNFTKIWSLNRNGAFAGTVFIGNTQTKPAEVFEEVMEKKQLISKLNSMNGFWGAVITDGAGYGWIAADRIRTYPVFYAQTAGNLYISSDAYWIREKCGLREIDSDAELEFLMTGYVTGSDTLISGIKQIQQGEVVFFEWSEEKEEYIFTAERYYRYLHQIPEEKSEDALLDELDQAMASAFKRLIDVAQGRTIAIPLSGGYDSRLVAMMLKRLGYNNLIAYTYGVKGYQEAQISKAVAENLQIPWNFIEYNNEKWYMNYRSDEFKRYLRYGGNLAFLAHVQDWIAVKELQHKNIFPQDTIFTPGLIANVGAYASHPSDTLDRGLTIDRAVSLVESRHYNYSAYHVDPELKQKMKARIISRMGDLKQYTCNLAFCDSFNFAERQAKYINNSIRGYEFWGYNHWTVFWDTELLDFWSKTPWNFILSKKLYDKYVFQQSKIHWLFDKNENIREELSPISKIAKISRKVLPRYVYSYIRTSLRARHIGLLKASPFAWYGCWNDNELLKHVKNGRDDVIKMLSYDYIDGIKSLK